MSPHNRSNNIAARVGRWSVGHRKTAIVGWLAFVIASVVIGGVVGTTYLEPSDSSVGEARKADRLIEAAGFNRADEQAEFVLIQSTTLKASHAAFRAAVEDVSETLAAHRQVRNLRSPLDSGHSDQLSPDGHSALVQFTPEGDYDAAVAALEAPR